MDYLGVFSGGGLDCLLRFLLLTLYPFQFLIFLLILFILLFVEDADQNASSFADLWLLVVVQAKLVEENAVLVLGEGAFEGFVGVCGGQPTVLHQGPKCSVVQIINMRVYLPPAEVGLHVVERGV